MNVIELDGVSDSVWVTVFVRECIEEALSVVERLHDSVSVSVIDARDGDKTSDIVIVFESVSRDNVLNDVKLGVSDVDSVSDSEGLLLNEGVRDLDGEKVALDRVADRERAYERLTVKETCCV